MTKQRSVLLLVLVLLAAPMLRGQATEATIMPQLQALGVQVPQAPGAPRPVMVPDAQRLPAIQKVAKDITSLPAGDSKVRLADMLVQATPPNETGPDATQAAADALAQALTETPQPMKGDQPAGPYMDLERLALYAQIETDLTDPMQVKAVQTLKANDADVQKADFTLRDVDGKKVTLSSLKGKIVLVDFWSGQCMACLRELQDLDLIYTHYQSQGLVILSVISPAPENLFDLNHFLQHAGYHPQVLLDDKGNTAKAFHVEHQPRSFVFNREGKLVAESVGMSTQRMFFGMLAKGGLHP